MFSTLPGVSAPPPFGGNQRTVVIHVDPERLRAYRISPEELMRAVQTGNAILPSGNVRTGDLNRIAPINSVVANFNTLADLPVRSGAGPAVYVRDLGYVDNSTDIPTGYALVDGKRTVYIPVAWQSPVREWIDRYGEIRDLLDRLSREFLQRLQNRDRKL